MAENERNSPGSHGFPETELYLATAARNRNLAIYGVFLLLSGGLTFASIFSGDRYNQIYFLFGGIALFALYRFMRELWKASRRVPEVRINAAGVRIYYPARLFWPWSRIRGAHQANGSVVVDLHPHAGIDQGVWNRADVDLGTAKLDCDGAEIERLVERGVKIFGDRA